MKRLAYLFTFASVLVSVSSAGAQSTLDLQEKCSKAAKKSFRSSGGYKTGKCSNTYESHYNKKVDKCFMMISTSCADKDESSTDISLADVFEGKAYATYTAFYAKGGVLMGRYCSLGDAQYNMVNGHEFNKQTRKWDIISEDYLKSLREPFFDPVRKKFDNWVKPYMEE